jgi:hypothetical protein
MAYVNVIYMAHMYIYIYTYIYMYIHIYIYVYAYIHANMSNKKIVSKNFGSQNCVLEVALLLLATLGREVVRCNMRMHIFANLHVLRI